MIPFPRLDGVLHAEAVPLSEIAAGAGTPVYVYSAGAIRERYRRLAGAFRDLPVRICYAVKANGNLAVLKVLEEEGAGADIVSAGEMARARAAGIGPERMVFSGVGKTQEELGLAVEAGIRQINVESVPELEALSAVAAARGVEQRIALRVNPDVDAKTHAKISTGRKENKFGIDVELAAELYARAERLPGLAPRALAVHIGSQLTDLAPYRAAFEHVAALVRQLRAAGLAVEEVDLGGGLGISYRDEAPPDFDDYAQVVRTAFAGLDLRITLEPGRALVGGAGLLLSRVIYVKYGLSRRFLIVDAAMNDLIRPSLYDAWHPIVPVIAQPGPAREEPYDIVGPICETGDLLASQRPLPRLAAGDLVAVLQAGAYGAVMASTYNARPLVPEVMVEGERFAVVRRRPTIEEALREERVPEWL